MPSSFSSSPEQSQADSDQALDMAYTGSAVHPEPQYIHSQSQERAQGQRVEQYIHYSDQGIRYSGAAEVVHHIQVVLGMAILHREGTRV